MPKFLYTIILTDLISLGFIIRIALFQFPETQKIIILMLLLIGIWIFLTLSLILFFINKGKSKTFYNPKRIYRRGLGISLVITIGVISLLTLKVLTLLNLLTGGLVLLLFVTLFLAVTSNKR